MKLFSNSIISMPISGCKDCPHRTHQTTSPSPGKFRHEYFCKLIFTRSPNIISGMEHRSYANITEPFKNEGTHPDCPLPDHEHPVRCSKMTVIALLSTCIALPLLGILQAILWLVDVLKK
ncbi:MAG: hypothetical protein PHY48_13995 [Candidatus Cloacimonetes bacterium]|nr:hypothetical protein [Candidatus Cloacimonadota bacterium]